MDTAARPTEPANYTVVARRYRPKSFDQLIGQDHIAQALRKAIETGRVGHAYLFTGARGVGKTSTARIFAKALNIPEGTPPEVAADISASIDAGDDIDVIEIDGASNRGIEEIRQLRSNISVRPSRAPYRIYIIDEVHMLTPQAFNALLKTLEEPPGHVKFIFCTTDPDKLPITVLSRCQRFDFAPVKSDDIQQRLAEICQQEGYQADPQALALLARRAAGSMRDSQSLLEQVMSFSSGEITAETVNAILGTANESRILELVERMAERDALGTLSIVTQSQREGADAGHLAEQLLGYLRDMMALAIGGDAQLFRSASPGAAESLRDTAQRLGLQTLLAAIQIVDEALVRMRSSVSAATLLEVALVEICNLEQFASLPELVQRLTATELAGDSQKKKADRPVATDPAGAQPRTTAPAADTRRSDPTKRDLSPTPGAIDSTVKPPADASSATGGASPNPAVSDPHRPAGPSTSALDIWKQVAQRTEGMLADLALTAEAVVPVTPNSWRIIFPPGADHACQMCSQPDRKQELTRALEAEAGKRINLTMVVREGTPTQQVPQESQSAMIARRTRELQEHPYIQKLCEELDAEIIRVDLGARKGSPTRGP